jgi:hypothetical protein
MAKIAKKYQRVFAGDIAPNNVIAEFGSLKAGSIAYSNDPDEIQSRTAWGDGLQSAMINNYNPAIQDINALLYLITRQIACIQQQGIPEWSADITYYVGSLVMESIAGDYRNGTVIFESLVNDNLNNALSDLAKWKIIKSSVICNYVTGAGLSTDIAYTDFMFSVFDASGSPVVINLPTPASGLTGREIIVQNKWADATNNKKVRVYVKNSSTIEGNAYIEIPYINAYARFICDGSAWYVLALFPGVIDD